jgi:hypothetical protein
MYLEHNLLSGGGQSEILRSFPMILSNQDGNSLSNSVHLILPTVSPQNNEGHHMVNTLANNNNRQVSSDLSRGESSIQSEETHSLQNLS